MSKKDVSKQLSLDLAEIIERGNKVMGNVSNIAALSEGERYERILDREADVDSINHICDSIVCYCDTSNLKGLVYQVQLLKNAAPNKLTINDPYAVLDTIQSYAFYLQQMSSSFSFFEEYSEYLVNNTEKPKDIEYFSECTSIPKPDTCISGIVYYNKADAPGNIQYTYLLGNNENIAYNLYNIYLNALRMNNSLDVSIENNVAFITQNNELIALAASGTDSDKGYFLMLSFKC